ncbi:MAG: glycosyltransferase [Burkholderiales bacterium]|nr:glycosyltransferase [Anaerolineae bacterium]
MSQHPKPQLIHILRTLSGGGPPRLVLGLIKSRTLADYRHTVVTLHDIRGDQGDMSAEFRDAGVRVLSCQPALFNVVPHKRLRLWLRNNTYNLLGWQLARVLQRLGDGVVHSQTDYALHSQATAIVASVGAPFIWTLQGFVSAKRDDELAAAMTICQKGGARVVAVSEAVKRDLLLRSTLPTDQCRVIYNGFSPSRLDSQAVRDEGWRRHQGIPPDAIVFGALGRLSSEKGYHLLLDALSRLVKQGIPAYALLVGEGPARESLEAQIVRLGLQSHAHLIGYQADIAFYLKQMDVFVMSSLVEGLGIALIEALSFGLPCIVTRVGGMPEVLNNSDDDSDNGMIVNPTVDALTQAMTTMLDTETRQTYGQRGAAVAQRFTLEHCAEQYSALYEEVLKSQQHELRR